MPQYSFSVKPNIKVDVMGKAANGLTFGQLGDEFVYIV